MKISIIIPTFNRKDDLIACINSIKDQVLKPDEILIVDDSSDDNIEKYINSLFYEFRAIDTEILYIRNNKGRSLTKARNLGIEKSKGEILFFLDDDVVLDSKYLEEAVNYYSAHPEIIGIQGLILNYPKVNPLVEIYNRIFLLNHTEKNKCRVLPSSRDTYPNMTKDLPIKCEWLSGCNHSYRKEIFTEFQYDEKMIRYSFREDLDMSYRVYKKYPDALILLPFAKCVHNESQSGRILKKEQYYMEIGYTRYFFYKNIEQGYLNSFLFCWSNFGLFIKNIGEILIKSDSERLYQIKILFLGYIEMRNYLPELKKGELSRFNESIFQD